MTLTGLVDSVLGERALVFGSLPPEGRDLDLLVSPAAEATLARELPERGFVRVGRTWARFRDCSVDVVELAAVETWRLPPGELEALFTEARPVSGCERLVRPAPHHALLILARRAMRDGAALSDRHRARIKVAISENGERSPRRAGRRPAGAQPNRWRRWTAPTAPVVPRRVWCGCARSRPSSALAARDCPAPGAAASELCSGGRDSARWWRSRASTGRARAHR